jgi:acetoin utilization protein AcuB
MRVELVKDWMTNEVITISPESRLSEIDRLMAEHAIRRLPVVENGRLIGIVSYGDVRAARPSQASPLSAWETNYLVSRITAGEIMTPNPLTISKDTIIGQAVQKMLENKFSSLPVVSSDGTLEGIITETDIFRMIVHEWTRNQDSATEPFIHYSDPSNQD